MSLRRRSPRPLSAALEPLQTAWTPDTTLARAQAAWSEAVGAYIAAEARPVAERGGVLTVACSASVWAQELDLMSSAIVLRLNQLLGGERISWLKCTVTGS